MFAKLRRRENDATGMISWLRSAPPSHYTLRVDSFSLFLENDIERYESGVFESSDYKWKLSLYPKGNKKRNVSDHISIYLVLANTDSLPLGWEVNVTFKLFLYDHIQDKYHTFQDAEENVRRLYRMKNEVGFDKLVPLATLNDQSSGYLLEDSLVIGAEVFVMKYNGLAERTSLLKNPMYNPFTWEITNFPEIIEDCIFSDEFDVGGYKWKLQLYPKGMKDAKGKCISLFLLLVDHLPLDRKVFAKFTCGVKDEKQYTAKNWFGDSSRSWGYHSLFSLDNLKATKSYLKSGIVTIEVKIILLSKFENL